VLAAYGWKVIEKKLPVELDEIENKEYANKMRDSGCCGADEFLKLWAYTLTDYHRVVHLDMDSTVFKNMVDNHMASKSSLLLLSSMCLMQDELYSIDKEFLYTGDWNMKGNSPVPPAQGSFTFKVYSETTLIRLLWTGGFLVIRPSMERFEEFRAVIRKGDYTGHSGWGGSHIGKCVAVARQYSCHSNPWPPLSGNFWGGETIQGILPYFYYSIHPGDALEVNR
jgi:hypothetical protein